MLSQVDYDTSLGLQGQAAALLATDQASADLTVPGTSENFVLGWNSLESVV